MNGYPKYVSALLAACLLMVAGASKAATVNAAFNSSMDVPVTAATYTATGNTINLTLNFTPPTGATLTVVKSTGLGFIRGTFENLAQGQTVALIYKGITYNFVANYYGGSGNDLVLHWADNLVYGWGNNSTGQIGVGTTLPVSLPTAVTSTGVLAGKTIVSISAGADSTVALCADGTVATWGRNTSGKLGNDSTLNSSVPVDITNMGVLATKRVVAVSAGDQHCLALCSDGTVASWGSNGNGELGNGNNTLSRVPVAVVSTGVLAGRSVVAISAGDRFSLALCSDGGPVTWGTGGNGQLGQAIVGTESNVPLNVVRTGVLSGKIVSSISAGSAHAIALCTDGTMVNWGSNNYGETGGTTGAGPRLLSPLGVLTGKTVTSISAGHNHSLALCSDGTLAAWGYNGRSELGNGEFANVSTPIAVNTFGVLAGKTITAIAGGGEHSAALCSDGTLAAWGSNASRQLGDQASSLVERLPILVATSPFGKRKAVALMTGPDSYHSFALTALPSPASDSAMAFLVPSSGNLEPEFTPSTLNYSTCVSSSTDSLTLTPTASNGSAAITVNGVNVVSGTASQSIPLVSGSNVISVTVTAVDGSTTTYGVTILRPASIVATYNSVNFVPLTTPAFDATGLNANLTLGFSPPNGTNLVVVRNTGLRFISGQFANVAQGASISLSYAGRSYEFVADYFGGSGNDLVLRWRNRTIYAFGRNDKGQLGNNSLANSNLPVPVDSSGVLAGKMVTSLASSESHTLALCSDGTIAAWGDNTYGQLGNGSSGFNLISKVPVAVTVSGVLSDKTIVAISASIRNSLALCSDGTVVAWGDNSSGQLGNNSSDALSAVPVKVASAGALVNKTVVAISAAPYCSIVLCSDGKLVSWGSNFNGLLGDGSTTSSDVPVEVETSSALAGKIVTSISSGADFILALCSDGTVVSWGKNGNGQLGNGYPGQTNLIYHNQAPVIVKTAAALGGKVVTEISAGGSHGFAYTADATVAAWGNNGSGVFGNNSELDSAVPVIIPPFGALTGRIVTGIAAGNVHSMALCSDGTAAASGGNSYGQLGNGSNSFSTVPVMVSTSALGSGVKFIGLSRGSGASHSILIAANPYPFSLSGLTGLSISSATLSPTFSPDGLAYTATVPNATTSISVTPTALNGNVIVTVNGTSVASGASSSSIPLAEGANSIAIVTTSPDGTTSKTYTINVTRGITLNANFTSSTSIPVTASTYNANGSVVNFSLGYAPTTGSALTVIRNTGPAFIGRFANLVQSQTVSLTFGNITYQFIANYYGGDGNDLELIWANNRTYDWGNNFNGQIGNNSTTNINLPFAVTSGPLAGRTLMRLANGDGHSLALCLDGTLSSWGDPSYGMLGLPGSPTGRLPATINPIGALTGKSVVAIGGGGSHSLALCSDGTLATWGTNSSGQLGNGSSTGALNTVNVPVAVSTNGVLAGKIATAISVGSSHNLVLCSDGTMASWGLGNNGQLGTGSTTLANTPFTVSNTGALAGKTVVSIASGSAHNLALCSDGTLVSWGFNLDGQLGNNSTTNSSVPIAINNFGVLAGKTVVAIGTGGNHSLALCSDGSLASWGLNDAGQLGINSVTSSKVPVRVTSTGVLAGKSIKGISAGRSHSLVLCSDGTLAAWGENYAGQFANGTFDIGSRVPVLAAKSGLGNGGVFTSLAAGSMASHVMAVVSMPLQTATALPASSIKGVSATLNGQINALGNNVGVTFEYGLDTGYGKSVAATPATVSGVSSTSVSAAIIGLSPGTVYHYRVIGASPAGTVRSADQTFTTLSDNAQLSSLTLGTGSLFPAFAKTTTAYIATVPFSASGVTVTPVKDHPGATIRVNGTTVTSGTPSTSIPLAVGNTTITTVVTAEDTIATKTYTVVITRLPQNFTFNSAADIPVTANGFSTGGYPVNVVLGYAPTPGTVLTAVRNTDVAFIQGRFLNLAHGQRINLTFGGMSYAFVVNYFGGSGNDLVLQWADTKAYSWGLNSYGQLGDASTTRRLIPVAVDDSGVLLGKTITSLGSGYLHSLALCSDGTLAAWGYNIYGQLGDGGNAPVSVPQTVDQGGVLSGRTVVAISAGPFHNLALCSDGTVAAWGYNNYGQLGTGNKITARNPVTVNAAGALSGKQVVAVAAGTYNSFALCSDGTIAAWGYNDEGELGDNTIISSMTPVAVNTAGALAGRKVMTLSTGAYHTLALCTDGTLVSWGYNANGQLGNNSTTFSKVPVAIQSFGSISGKAVIALAAGSSHSLALCSDGSLSAWGSNTLGELGSAGASTIPKIVNLGAVATGESISRIAAGSSHSAVTFADGVAASWGANANGQLGNNSTTGGTTAAALDATSFEFGAMLMDISTGSASNHRMGLLALPSAVASSQLAYVGVNEGEDLEDPDHDGICNLLEYAFGLDPNLNSAGLLPQPVKSDGAFVINFVEPVGAAGLLYSVEWSPSLLPNSWMALPDTGRGKEHTFLLPANDHPSAFFRFKVARP